MHRTHRSIPRIFDTYRKGRKIRVAGAGCECGWEDDPAEAVNYIDDFMMLVAARYTMHVEQVANQYEKLYSEFVEDMAKARGQIEEMIAAREAQG